ncbi:hypothetical protein Tsubulata_013257 [Turnera subulata]|uniref:aspartate--tRNA ligase n=1 Tax=Turnera subulata TaxID=218843 RepID=A0A9Q0FFZ4_9ROSI|nr:hypothetical protein Tsubulata_013257 [Turnera subulata]
MRRALPTLPFSIEDAARSEQEIEEASQAGEQLVRVNQDTRLDFRYLDTRTPAKQAIFRIQCQVSDFLLSEGFCEIHTPSVIAGSSEGGSAVFKLDYFKDKPGCLAQSPQLHKQMAICGGFGRVFEVGPVFRAEKSFAHRHLCEFIGLDVEMQIEKHYSEVMDMVDRLFAAIFDSLNEKCSQELDAVARQYPFKPARDFTSVEIETDSQQLVAGIRQATQLDYLRKTLRLRFEEGIQMLSDAGVEVDPYGDLNTKWRENLASLLWRSMTLNSKFFIAILWLLGLSIPCHDMMTQSTTTHLMSSSEEKISGAQRIHVAEVLSERAGACGIDVNTISTYIDAFRYGAPPHGGFGVGLERLVMLFCGLNNIRKTSLFPRDPKRISP